MKLLATITLALFAAPALAAPPIAYEVGDVIRNSPASLATLGGYTGDFYGAPLSIDNKLRHSLAWMGNSSAFASDMTFWAGGNVESAVAGPAVGGLNRADRAALGKAAFSPEFQGLIGNDEPLGRNNIIDVLLGSGEPPAPGYTLIDEYGNLRLADIRGIRHDGWQILLYKEATGKDVHGADKNIFTYTGIQKLNDKEVNGSLLVIAGLLDSILIGVQATTTVASGDLKAMIDLVGGAICSPLADWAFGTYIDSLTPQQVAALRTLLPPAVVVTDAELKQNMKDLFTEFFCGDAGTVDLSDVNKKEILKLAIEKAREYLEDSSSLRKTILRPEAFPLAPRTVEAPVIEVFSLDDLLNPFSTVITVSAIRIKCSDAMSGVKAIKVLQGGAQIYPAGLADQAEAFSGDAAEVLTRAISIDPMGGDLEITSIDQAGNERVVNFLVRYLTLTPTPTRTWTRTQTPTETHTQIVTPTEVVTLAPPTLTPTITLTPSPVPTPVPCGTASITNLVATVSILGILDVSADLADSSGIKSYSVLLGTEVASTTTKTPTYPTSASVVVPLGLINSAVTVTFKMTGVCGQVTTKSISVAGPAPTALPTVPPQPTATSTPWGVSCVPGDVAVRTDMITLNVNYHVSKNFDPTRAYEYRVPEAGFYSIRNRPNSCYHRNNYGAGTGFPYFSTGRYEEYGANRVHWKREKYPEIYEIGAAPDATGNYTCQALPSTAPRCIYLDANETIYFYIPEGDTGREGFVQNSWIQLLVERMGPAPALPKPDVGAIACKDPSSYGWLRRVELDSYNNCVRSSPPPAVNANNWGAKFITLSPGNYIIRVLQHSYFQYASMQGLYYFRADRFNWGIASGNESEPGSLQVMSGLGTWYTGIQTLLCDYCEDFSQCIRVLVPQTFFFYIEDQNCSDNTGILLVDIYKQGAPGSSATSTSEVRTANLNPGGPTYNLVCGEAYPTAWFTAPGTDTEADGTVATWPDRSGHGRDAVAGGVDGQPLKTIGRDGYPTLDFDGDDDSFVITNSSGIITDPYNFTVMAKAYFNPDGGGKQSLLGSGTSQTAGVEIGLDQDRFSAGGCWNPGWFRPNPTGPSVLALRMANGKASVFENGHLVAVKDAPYCGGSLSVGGTIRIGSSLFGGSAFRGELAELMFFDQALGDASIGTITECMGYVPLKTPTPTVTPTVTASILQLVGADGGVTELPYRQMGAAYASETLHMNGLNNCASGNPPAGGPTLFRALEAGVYRIRTIPGSCWSYQGPVGYNYLTNKLSFGMASGTPAAPGSLTALGQLGFQQDYESKTCAVAYDERYVALSHPTTLYFVLSDAVCGDNGWNVDFAVDKVQEGIPAALATPTFTQTASPTASPTPTATETSTPSPTATETPTASPTGTPTPSPTVTAAVIYLLSDEGAVTTLSSYVPLAASPLSTDDFIVNGLTNCVTGNVPANGSGPAVYRTYAPGIYRVRTVPGSCYSYGGSFGVVYLTNAFEFGWAAGTPSAPQRLVRVDSMGAYNGSAGFTCPAQQFSRLVAFTQTTTLYFVLPDATCSDNSWNMGIQVDKLADGVDAAIATATPNYTRTSTPTVTPTPTLAPPKLDLQVWNPNQASDEYRLSVKITNWGSEPIALNRIKVKVGFYLSTGTSLLTDSSPNSQKVYNASNVLTSSVAAPAVQIQTINPAKDCGNNRKANRVTVVSFTDANSVVIPPNGGYVRTLDVAYAALALWYRSSGTFNRAYDYSRVTEAGMNYSGRQDLPQFTLYLDGALVCEWSSAAAVDPNSGKEPCGPSACEGGLAGGGYVFTARLLGGGPKETVVPFPRQGAIAAAPNPARNSILAGFDMAEGGEARLSLQDLTGRTVRQWDLGTLGRGEQRVPLDLGDLASGVYLLSFSRDTGQGMSFQGTFKLGIVR